MDQQLSKHSVMESTVSLMSNIVAMTDHHNSAPVTVQVATVAHVSPIRQVTSMRRRLPNRAAWNSCEIRHACIFFMLDILGDTLTQKTRQSPSHARRN
jgi:hypothetical protein